MPVNKLQFRYRKCSVCGTVFSDPLPPKQKLEEYYREHYNYGWFEERVLLKKIQAAHRWQRVAALLRKYQIPQGRLLDVGCGHGLFLARAVHAKWVATGVDYPSLATFHAREKLSLKVVEGDFRTLATKGELGKSNFDFITTWHCLEHDIDPLAYLRAVKQLLAPKGKVLIAVPNADALGMEILRENWVWCQEPYVHVIHYTEKSLAILAAQAGLKVLTVWTRNTWDANPSFDVKTASLLALFSRHMRRISYRAAFWLEEGVRLACYAACCYRHWALGRESSDMRGSELLMLAERNDS